MSLPLLRARNTIGSPRLAAFRPRRALRTIQMTANGTADKLIDDLHAVIRDAETLLRATAAQTGEKIEEARTRAEESVRQAKQRLAGIEDEALERARVLA